MPFALLILLNVMAVTLLSPALGITQAGAFTIMYYITALAGVMAVITACRPFNKLRMFLCVTTVVLLSAALCFFQGILGLDSLSRVAWGALATLCVLAVPIQMLCTRLVHIKRSVS